MPVPELLPPAICWSQWAAPMPDVSADGARDAGQPNESIHQVEDADSAAELLRRVLRPGDVVLVKGSRGVGLDRTVEALTGEEAA